VADVRIAPKQGVILLTVINAGGGQAEEADRLFGRTLIDHLKLVD
jgi:hypothetical protein